MSVGRPTKLDDLTAKRIVDALKAGNSRRCAAQAGGLDYATLKRWLARGKDEQDGDYCAFRARVERAESEIERDLVKVVVTAAKDDPKLALEWLARRRRATWARQDNAKKSDVAAPLDALTPEQMREFIADQAANDPELLAQIDAKRGGGT